MNIIFFGASKLGFEVCQSIINQGHTVSMIFTIGETFEIRNRGDKKKVLQKNSLFVDFDHFYKENGIPVISVNGDVTEYIDLIREKNPYLFIVIGWYYLISEKVLLLSKYGAVGIHASLLPKYRGNAPLVWSVINGEKTTGVSLFYIEKGVDEGDIVAQREIIIHYDDYISDLLLKVEIASLQLISENIEYLLMGKAKRVKQDINEISYFPRRIPDDGFIDWGNDSNKIYNFIRAQSRPYTGAFTFISTRKMKIWKSEIVQISHNLESGNYWTENKIYYFVCGDMKIIKVYDYQFGE